MHWYCSFIVKRHELNHPIANKCKTASHLSYIIRGCTLDLTLKYLYLCISLTQQVPEVCVNGNYPPDLVDESGNVDFPTFLPPFSDFSLQASSPIHWDSQNESLSIFLRYVLPYLGRLQ